MKTRRTRNYFPHERSMKNKNPLIIYQSWWARFLRPKTSKTMFSSSLPPIVCRRAHVLFMLFVFVQQILTVRVTWQVIYKWQELLTLHEHLDSTAVFGGAVLLIFLVFCVVFLVGLCCSSLLVFWVVCFVCLLPVSCVPNVVNVSGLSTLDCPFDFL